MRAASKILGLLSGILFAGAAWGQAAPISGQVINQYGQPLPFAQVLVCSVTSTGTPCTPPAAIYYDYGFSSPAPNPYTTDQYGNYAVYGPALAAPNLYIVQVSPSGVIAPSGVTWTYVVNGPYFPASGGTITGNLTVTGIINAETTPYYEVNGTQLASTNLGDTGNIAYKNAANTFTGGTQIASIFNATTQFDVAGVQIASSNLSDAANLAKLGSSNTFTGATNTFAAITGTTINASTGFEIAGGASNNHVLLGNGARYVDSATIPYSIITGTPTLYYQTVNSNGTGTTQESALNFTTRFTVTPIVSPSESTVDLAAVGTAGTYLYPTSITTDTWGRITAITGGSTAETTYDFSYTGCTIMAGSGVYCTATINFTTSATPVHSALADTNYTVQCTPNMTDASDETGGANISFNLGAPLTTTGFTYYIGGSVTTLAFSHTPVVYCHLYHP